MFPNKETMTKIPLISFLSISFKLASNVVFLKDLFGICLRAEKITPHQHNTNKQNQTCQPLKGRNLETFIFSLKKPGDSGQNRGWCNLRCAIQRFSMRDARFIA